MKRKSFLILFIAGLTAMTWAQGWEHGRNAPNRRQMPAAETVTVSGSLIVAHGMPAVRIGDTTYLVGRLSRLSGFIDGLREGAEVTIEGSAIASRRDTKLKFLNPTQLTLAGRSHDLTPAAPAFGFDRAFGAPPQMRHFNAPQGPARQFCTPRQGRHPRSQAAPQRGPLRQQRPGEFRR